MFSDVNDLRGIDFFFWCLAAFQKMLWKIFYAIWCDVKKIKKPHTKVCLIGVSYYFF
jgi:hypothetical protein